MFYVDALNLINLCLEHDVLQSVDNGVLVYHDASETDAEGWYLEDKESLAQELMQDEKGQEVLISALKEKSVELKLFDFTFLDASLKLFKKDY